MKETVHIAHPKKARFVAVRLTERELTALDSIKAVRGLTSRSEALREAISSRYLNIVNNGKTMTAGA